MNARILIADDEAGIRDLMQFELAQCGHSVHVARDGLDAVARIEEREFDLVITDVRMPGADGLAVLRAARDRSPTTEVIVVTGYADIDTAVECLRCGAYDLVRKPFDLTELLSKVDRALERRRMRMTARLYEACQLIIGTRGEQPLCERIADTAMALLEADDVSVMLNDATGSLRIVYATGLTDAIQAETRLRLGERIAGRVALDRSPAILPDALKTDERFTDVEGFGRVRSAIVYPLVHRERLLGVINFNRTESEKMFGGVDLEMAGIVAAQAALALSNERLTQQVVASERMAAIGQVSAGIVHELSNPLTYLGANAALAREAVESLSNHVRPNQLTLHRAVVDLDELLLEVNDGVDVLMSIVNDMRGLSREAADRDERFDVNDAIRTAVRISRPSIQDTVRLQLELADELHVLGSPGRLSQVFLNLVVNAAHAVAEVAETNPRIEIRSWREAEEVHVEVTDDGPGISEAHLSRIMQPFFTTKGSSQGTGLGLAISRDIVEQHAGDLRVRSVVGEGATFTVVLPLRDVGDLGDSEVRR